MHKKSMNFTYDDALLIVNNWAKDKFIKENIDYDESGEVPYFIQYLNYRSKLVIAKPRNVVLSKQFSISPENKKGFDRLKEKLINGEDVNAYLSKSSIIANSVDGMLDNFGIKHFHLGEIVKNDFIERTGEIALGLVTDSEVFFVVSKQHGKGYGDIWYEKDVLEKIHKEKPNLICKVENMIDISSIISDTKDIKFYRNSNINGAITLDDGSATIPFNLGQSLAGFSISYTMKIQYIAKNIFNLANKLLKNSDSIEVTKFDLTEEGELKFLEFKLWNGNKYVLVPFFRWP
jgi:hypothetical protein